jgi:hypothetical protein
MQVDVRQNLDGRCSARCGSSGTRLLVAVCFALTSGLLLGQTATRGHSAESAAPLPLRLNPSESALQMRTPASTQLIPSQDFPVPAVDQKAPLILFQSGLIAIHANGAGLRQILQEISELSGMQIEGLNEDEQVFGSFGPGESHEVLTALLNGSRYNIVMAGHLRDGAPRNLLLSRRKDAAGQEPVQPIPQPSTIAEASVPFDERGPEIADADTNSTPANLPVLQKSPEEVLLELQRLQATQPHP